MKPNSRSPSLRRGVVFLLFAALLAPLAACQKYDAIVDKEQVVDQRWADVQAQLQRRYDLIPNLVNTVRASARHEEETLTRVVEARSQATRIQLTPQDLENPARMQQFQQAQDNLSSSLSRLMMVHEAYPELRANQGFHDLQVQLEGTENRILRAREQFNAAVRDYNSELRKVGGNVINRATGRQFRPRAFYNASAAVQTAPQVNF
jgi:LemA protein